MVGLATLLVFGQFLCCLVNTSQLWPFNPILVYVGQTGQQVRGCWLVAYSATEEVNVVELGWCQELVGRKLASGLIALEKKGVPLQGPIADLAGHFASRGRGRFLGLRLYRLVWDLPMGKVVQQERVAECPWP